VDSADRPTLVFARAAGLACRLRLPNPNRRSRPRSSIARVAVELPEPGTFLALLSDDDRDAVLNLGGPRRFASGERLMHQGDPGEHVLILLEGHAKASTIDSRGREMVLSFRGPGDVLGELTFTSGDPRSSNVTAIEPVGARGIAAGEFRVYLEQRATAALTLIDVISRRFREANSARAQFGDLDTVGRVAARLIELCERYGDRTDSGIQIRLPVTQDDLGSWTASSRAGVANALRTMRELGWIQTERRRITVLEPDAVRQRAS
jgi:CRP/FNR family transcriptional regulator, cyclic AMP receptor protein